MGIGLEKIYSQEVWFLLSNFEESFSCSKIFLKSSGEILIVSGGQKYCRKERIFNQRYI